MNFGGSIRFRSGLASLLACIHLMTACELEVDSTDAHMCSEPHAGSVGIGITVVNGEPVPIELVASRRYHIDSITLKANLWGASTDDFLAWVQSDSVFSSLNWEGSVLAQSHWRESHLGDGSANFTETRIYQDAAWMGEAHTFSVTVLDDTGNALLGPITLRQKQFFMNVRGTVGWALGAPSRGDYGTEARYSGEAIVWSSGPCGKSPEFVLPAGAAGLSFGWSGTEEPVVIPLAVVEEGLTGPGFRMDITTRPPENGLYFKPGETIEGRLELKDGSGHLLHPEDRLPTYRDFIEGRSNGIAYTVPGEEECLAGFSDCFEDIMMVSLAGPKDRIEPHYGAEPPTDYFAVEETIPPMPVIYGGYGNREVWDTPISNSFAFTLPPSVLPGTYVLIVKGSRVFQGERTNLMKEIDLQVGTDKTTEYGSQVGNCDLCHVKETRLDRLRHGTEDYRTCKICHVFPHSTPFPEMIHLVHFYSPAYPSPPNDCSHCHLKKESMLRNSVAVCGVCHGDGLMNGQYIDVDPYTACGSVCHNTLPTAHLTGPE